MDIPETLMSQINEEEKKEMSMDDFFKGLESVDIKQKKGSWKNSRLEFKFIFGGGAAIVSVTMRHMTPDVFNSVFFLKTRRFMPARFHSLDFWRFFIEWAENAARRKTGHI